MALPYNVVVSGFLATAAGLALAFLAAPRLEGVVGLGRASAARLAAGVALTGLIGGAFGLNALGAPLDPSSRPLQFGHSYGGDDPRLIATRDSPGSHTIPRLWEYDYAYSPGAEVRIAFTLSNASRVPLTVVDIESAPNPNIRSVEFRLPPRLGSDLPPTYPAQHPGQAPDAWASQPFRSFEIPAQDEVGLAVAVTLGECPGTSPAPTLAPGASPLAASDPALGGGFDILGVVDVRYVQLGIERTATIVLPFAMRAITSDTSTYGCPAA